MYWYLGCLDFGKFGFYAVFREYQGNDKDERDIFIRFENSGEFSRDEFLNEYRVMRTSCEDELLKRVSKDYDSLNKVICGILLDALSHVNKDSEEELNELSYYISRRVHLSDPRF